MSAKKNPKEKDDQMHVKQYEFALPPLPNEKYSHPKSQEI